MLITLCIQLLHASTFYQISCSYIYLAKYSLGCSLGDNIYSSLALGLGSSSIKTKYDAYITECNSFMP